MNFLLVSRSFSYTYILFVFDLLEISTFVTQVFCRFVYISVTPLVWMYTYYGLMVLLTLLLFDTKFMYVLQAILNISKLFWWTNYVKFIIFWLIFITFVLVEYFQCDVFLIIALTFDESVNDTLDMTAVINEIHKMPLVSSIAATKTPVDTERENEHLKPLKGKYFNPRFFVARL